MREDGSVADALMSVVWLGLLALKAWALLDCLRRPGPAFELHGKQTKTIWLAILAVSLLLGLVSGALGILGIVGTVAAIVYLVDVRPAVSGKAF
jgi:hypothetical protein